MDAILQYFCVFVMTISFGIGITSMQCNIALENDRYDCLPEDGATQQKCVLRGCCWAITKTPGAPYCFYPSDSPGYRVVKSASTAFGETYMLNLGSKTSWPDNVMTLQLDVRFETKSRLHFKIYDPFRRRYEVPISTPKVSTKAADMDYAIKIHPDPFGITVSRKSSGAVIFNSNVSAPLIFANQFLQIASELSSPYLYGLGEHQGTFLKNISWAQMAFWARDVPPMNDVNLYGDHPFYLNIEKDGQAHGVFLLNSNAMSVSLQPTPSIIYRTTGGILDFYIFLGPSPQDVVQQYTDVIGKPYLPPYWSLGFHLCRWGYNSSNMTRTVIERMRRGKFPYVRSVYYLLLYDVLLCFAEWSSYAIIFYEVLINNLCFT
ncbi:lysosomal alpha-glucosidase-like [Lingula anatina]|uniref:Lysosomal alpha-glucosidase-like n=1 Tax=Lingula anatina TaxID=7574 RepID=A0A1S3JBB1_LINAN|nr:lysosomal alpha-glucosidase-like [Lingula anatina]|eukprot:XP_013407695.1 lysosomal alpha-glucosidase-like [Lingula anatina]